MVEVQAFFPEEKVLAAVRRLWEGWEKGKTVFWEACWAEGEVKA